MYVTKIGKKSPKWQKTPIGPQRHVAKPGEVFKNTESFMTLFRVLSICLLIVFGIWTIISNIDRRSFVTCQLVMQADEGESILSYLLSEHALEKTKPPSGGSQDVFITPVTNNITSWKMSPNIFYILFGAFIVVYVIIFIHTCCLEKRTKILSEAVTDTLTEKYQAYVIEVTETSDITKANMESKCQDLQILKSNPIFPQELAIQRQTSLHSYNDLMYQQNCQIQENPPPYQY